MWFPTNTQEKIYTNLDLIEEYFIEYYGEKYKDKIKKKFKEFIFIAIHDNLVDEKNLLADVKNKIICKHLKLFLDKLGIKESFSDYVLNDIYEQLVHNDIDFLIENIEKVSKKKVNKLLFLLNFKTHIKYNKKMISDIEKDISEINGRYDFIKIMEVIKKFQYDYLKEIYTVLSDKEKQIFDDPNKDIDYKLDKLYDYLPNINFESSTIEFLYEKYGIDYVNNFFNMSLNLNVEDIKQIMNARTKIKNELIEYLHSVYEDYLKNCLSAKEISVDIKLSKENSSTCSLKEIQKEDRSILFSIITYVLPLSDCTCIHELNHHIESYINSKNHGISGWLPIQEKNLDKINNCSLLLDEVINDLISEDIVKLMHINGKYILDSNSKSDSDYLIIRSLVEKFFYEFKDIIIESRIGENPSILYEKLGEKNLEDLNKMFKEIESHNDYPFNITVEFLQYYQKKFDNIFERMLNYYDKKYKKC